MKILFLDDDTTRTRKFREQVIGHHIVAAETASEAITALKTGRFDVVCLDHDLGGQIFTASDENSGHAVAEYIAGLAAKDWPSKIVVHSFNPVGADKMIMTLAKGAERSVVTINATIYKCAFGTDRFWEALGVRV